jgi:hypothetical protein
VAEEEEESEEEEVRADIDTLKWDGNRVPVGCLALDSAPASCSNLCSSVPSPRIDDRLIGSRTSVKIYLLPAFGGLAKFGLDSTEELALEGESRFLRTWTLCDVERFVERR